MMVTFRTVSLWEKSAKQDHQALLKAKYCPRVAAESRSQKNTKTHVTLTYDRWPWNSAGFWRLSRHMCVQNVIKLSAAVHELSCTQTILSCITMVKSPRIRSCDLELWPMIFKINSVREVIKVHVPAKIHQAACSGSWVIVLTGKKTPTKTIQSVATARTVTRQ